MHQDTNFPFIQDSILQQNLDMVFDHILELILVIETSNNLSSTSISSFRKTLIIYTASIVEALLLYKLKLFIKSDILIEKDKKNKWVYPDVKVLHKLPGSTDEIIAGTRKIKEIETRVDKINFEGLVTHCKINDLITEDLYREIKKLKNLRNRLHIGGLKEIEKGYSEKDLKLAFSAAQRLKSTF